MEDIIYKIVFTALIVLFPLYYIGSGLMYALAFIRSAHDEGRKQQVQKHISKANTFCQLWCLVLVATYAVVNYTSYKSFFYDKQVDIWFYLPLFITGLGLFVRKLKRHPVSWIFVIAVIIICWILFFTFYQLSLS